MQYNSNHYRDHLNNVMSQSFKSFEDAKLQNKQFRHDIKITIISTILGAVSGLITSVIFWLITK